jgi:hypothetical protein
MPSGVASFVRGQGQDNNSDSPTEKELARRRDLALNAKIQPRSSYKTPTQSRAVPDRRTAPPAHTYAQPSRGYKQDGEDLFAGSELEDSDDTTRDLGLSNMRGYQAMLSPLGKQNFGSGNGMDQASEPRYPDEFGDNTDGAEHDPDEEDDQFDGFRFPNGTAPVSNSTLEALQEKALRYRDSENFSKAQKLHNSKFCSSHLPPVQPGISGRFTPANALAADIRRHPTGLGGIAEAHHLQRNDQAALDDLASNGSDDHIHPDNLQQEGQGHVNQLERITRNGVDIEHDSSGREQAGDRFSASELDSAYSGGSSQPSPSQHTPRANGQSNKQTPTSSQAGKRKKADLELDYDTNTLSSMNYSEIKDQPFDSNPKAPPSVIPEFLSGPEASLEDHLEHFRGSEPEDQISFFAQMPLDQWEQSGDWFLGRFGDIMSKLKDARRAKRDISKAFEEELAGREQAVRANAEGIQEVFRQMRAGGEGVLKGRTP